MNIYLASISHRHGVNLYAAATKAELNAKLADYCRDYWDGDGPDEAMPEADDEIVDRYFEASGERMNGEFLERGEDEIVTLVQSV